ncbi:bZIP transcription factor [Apiospora sp. TS-2023a]
MVSNYQVPAYFKPNPLSVDTQHAQKCYDDGDNDMFEDSIMDHSALDSGLEMSPPMAGSRRDSFAVSSSLFSPKTEDWQSVDMQSVPSNNPFLPPNNPFMNVDQSQGYGNQNQWSLGQASGTCTPLQAFDGMPTDYDGSASLFAQRPMSMQTPFSNPSNQVPLFQTVGPNNHSIPTSPQKEWMGKDVKNQQAMIQRMRPESPMIRSHNDLRRGDGIRKKNARFDIPAERNLSNIDYLISQSTDEQEIKELKQQKRLLRNRQAALDSRQRKKMHTERLEDEKKQYTVVISNLEDEVAQLNLRLDQLMRDREFTQNHIENLQMEKEELIQNHTIESGELRKKVSVLTDHVHRLEGAATNNNGNNGFPNSFNSMDGMTMDGSWDNMNFMGDFTMEQEVKQDVQVVPAKKPEVTLSSQVEKPEGKNGLLFMLFLVGAFVMSNRSTPSIPRVSEDMREASSAILDSVLKDAGVSHTPDVVTAAVAPQASGTNWATATPMELQTGMEGVAPSMLGELGDSLTQPTQEQTTEQIFSMTSAQYNGATSQDFMQNIPVRSTSQGRRNLAESLAAMRNNDKQSAADVYSRSLLWDQIPRDVVRNFARMVAEANPHSDQHASNDAHS